MRRRRCRGQALVEFALSAPLLLALLFGAMHFGYAFYTWNNLQKAVRDGARYAAERTYGAAVPAGASATFAPADANYKTAIANVVVFGSPTAGTAPVVHGLAVGDIAVTMKSVNGYPYSVTVAVSSYTIPGVLGAVALTNKPSCTFRFIGRYAPPVT